MKNILLPTDLSVQSLWPIHQVVKEANHNKVNIYLVHLISLPTSITDLLFLNEEKYYSEVPLNFTEALQVFRNKYRSTIQQIDFKFIYCNSNRYLRNYVEGNNIQAIYRLADYNYKLPLKESVDFLNRLVKIKIPMKEISLNKQAVHSHETLSVLLNGELKKAPAEVIRPEAAISYS